jgi:hypothetical protein
MDSGQTLHDFVLNLLSDPAARTAFELDPEGALRDAGLSDITAVDVQDVIPLVIDYVPTGGLADLDTGQLGPSALDAGPAGAVQQLQLVTQQLPLLGGPSATEVNAAAAGTLTAGSVGLDSWVSASASADEASVSAGVEPPGGDAFDVSQDLTVTLDAPALDGAAVDLGTAEVTSGGTVDMGGTGGLDLGGTLTGLTGTVDGVTGSLDVTGTLDGVTGGLAGGLTDGLGLDLDHPTSSPALAPAEQTVHGAVSGVHGAVSGVTGTVDGVGAGGLTGTVDDATQHLPAGGVVGDVTDLLF